MEREKRNELIFQFLYEQIILIVYVKFRFSKTDCVPQSLFHKQGSIEQQIMPHKAAAVAAGAFQLAVLYGIHGGIIKFLLFFCVTDRMIVQKVWRKTGDFGSDKLTNNNMSFRDSIQRKGKKE